MSRTLLKAEVVPTQLLSLLVDDWEWVNAAVVPCCPVVAELSDCRSRRDAA